MPVASALLVLACVAGALCAGAHAQVAHITAQELVLMKGLDEPTGVAVDSSGRVFVSSHYGGGYSSVQQAGPPDYVNRVLIDTGNNDVMGMATDANGNVYLAKRCLAIGENCHPAIGKLTRQANGSYVASEFGKETMVSPAGIALDSSGNIYVSDLGRNAIVKETPQPDGSFTETVLFDSARNGLALGKGTFYMAGIAVDNRGNIYIADAGNNRLLKETPNGSGGYNQSIIDGGFSKIQGIAVDKDGNVYAADAGTFDVVMESPSGNGYTRTTVANTLRKHLMPLGVTVDAYGMVYVAYSNHNLTLNADGRVLRLSRGSILDFGEVAVGTWLSGSVLFTFDQADSIVRSWEKAVMFSNFFSSDIVVDSNDTGTCQGKSFLVGDSCWVNLVFSPSKPGPRYDAVGLFNKSAEISATGLVHGTGVGPLVTFQEGAQSVAVNLGTNSPTAMALDQSGNLYVAESSGSATQLRMHSPASGTARIVASNLSQVWGVAVDGYGSLYITDAENGRVLKKTPQLDGHYGIASWSETVIASGLSFPTGVAVDGDGNVYIADTGQSRILKETLVNGAYLQSEIISTGLVAPQGLAVDGRGRLYITDFFKGLALVMTPNADGTYSTTATFDQLSQPQGIAVDGGGSVYIADSGNSRVVKETLSNGSYTESVLGSDLHSAAAVAVDDSGNVYIANNAGSNVFKLDYATPPSLSFAPTNLGATSSDSPKTIAVENSGNAALRLPVPAAGNNPSLAPNFVLDNSAPTACPVLGTASSAATLAPGAFCTLAIGFAPTDSGTVSGSLVLTDNHLNAAAPNYAKQTLSLTGTAVAPVSISVTPGNQLLLTGETQQFTAMATYSDSSTQDVTSLVTWSSSNTSVASITTLGLARGKAVGTAQIRASIDTLQSGPATLAVNPVPAGSIAVYSGNGQSANVYTRFGAPLTVRVLDTYGLPAQGETVTFAVTPSPSGASASFSSVTTYTTTNVATTGSDGIASIFATANSATGSYTVTATTGGKSATFTLTNVAAPFFMVTTLTDSAAVASNCTDQSQPGAKPDAQCSLRDAIAQAKQSANAIPFGDPIPTYLIRFSSSLFQSANPSRTYLLVAGALSIYTNINIEGPGANLLTISAEGRSQVITTAVETNLIVSGVTITGSKGTAISAAAALTVNNCVLSGNTTSVRGGAIDSYGTLIVTGSTFSNNTAAGDYTRGGAIYIADGKTATVSNSTFSGNSATYGGGIYNGGILTVTNSTFANNLTRGLENNGTLTLANNLILDAYYAGTGVTDSGGNVFSDSVGVTPLGAHGGLMSTLLPLPGSAAICAGTQSNATAAGLVADQRGYSRTTTYSGSVCVDAGAVQTEYQSVQFAGNSYSGIVNQAVTPAPVVSVTERGQNWEGIPITLTYTGAGTPTGLGPSTTIRDTGATFASLVSASAGSSTLSVSMPITSSGNAVQPAALTASVPLDIAPAIVQIALGTSPSGLSFSADGDTYTLPQTTVWDAGSQHTLGTTQTQYGSGMKYDFLRWSDGVTSITDTVTAPSVDAAYTAIFSPSYWLEVSANAGGTVSATDGSNNDVNWSYLAANSTVTLKAVPASGYYFKNWSGMTSAGILSSTTSATATLTMPATPETIKADFALIPGFVVTTNGDLSAGVAGNCVDQKTGHSSTGGTDNSNCSLRDALAAATAHGGTITFSPQVFQASGTSASNTISIAEANGALQVPSGAVITGLATSGTGAPFITIDGGGKSRVFNVADSAASTSISNLIVAHGLDSAIGNSGTLAITTAIIRDSAGTSGGGIANLGTLTVTNSTISGNSATTNGGGIANLGSALTITNSTLSGNSAATSGGGIYGGASLLHTTVSANTAADGGGIYIPSLASVNLINSILSGNSLTGGGAWPDRTGAAGTIVSSQRSIDGTPAGLAPLGNYGGPTPTMMPLPGSPAICRGNTSLAALPSTDQRGTARTTTYGSTTCADAGAVQTHYSLVFSTQPAAVPPADGIMAKVPFQAGVTLQENATSPASAGFAQAGIVIPLTLTGAGTLSPSSLTTNSSGVANSNSLTIDTAGTGRTLTASIPLTASGVPTTATISATSNAFDLQLPVPSVTLTLNQSQQSYGAAFPASAVSASANLGGTPVSGTWTYTTTSIAAGSVAQPLAPGVTILPVGTYTIAATFTPTNASYESSSAQASYTVTSATPTISAWPTASAITYGQTLASSTLSGGAASTAGTFAFTSPTTAPGAGTYTASMMFTPTDTANYARVSGTVEVAVNKATPSVTVWPTASAITYGQTLASSTLSGGTASMGGAFSFAAPATSPNAGPYTASVVFTPADATNYATVSGTVDVTVNNAAAGVTVWPTASAITYGQTLASSTLSGGSASVDGNFVWTTPATAPGVGTAAQSVTFTPMDASYSTVTGTASVTVSKGTPTVDNWPSATEITYGQTLASSRLSGGGASVGGTFAWATSTTAPDAGTAAQSVTFIPTDTTDYNPVAGTASVTVVKAAASLILSSPMNPALVGNSVTFTATASSGASGTVDFYDGATRMGSVALSHGVAAYIASSLAAGTHSITASYAGDKNYLSAASAAISQIVEDFTVTGTGAGGGTSGGSGSTTDVPTQTIQPGGTAAYSVQVAPSVGTTLAADIVLMVTHNLPAGSTVVLTAAGNSGTTLVLQAGQAAPAVQLTVHLASTAATLHRTNPLSTMPFAFGFLLLPFSGSLGRAAGKRVRRGGLGLMLLLVVLAAIVGLAGCGAVNSGRSAQQNYTITVTATSGTLSHSTNFNLTVQ